MKIITVLEKEERLEKVSFQNIERYVLNINLKEFKLNINHNYEN